MSTWEFYIEHKTDIYFNANLNNQLIIHQIILLKVNSLVTHQKNVFKNGDVQSSDPKILQGNSRKKNFFLFFPGVSRGFQEELEIPQNSKSMTTLVYYIRG